MFSFFQDELEARIIRSKLSFYNQQDKKYSSERFLSGRGYKISLDFLRSVLGHLDHFFKSYKRA